MISITLYRCLSEPNKLNKVLTDGDTVMGSLREGSPVIDPVITVEAENVSYYNYAYVDAFARFYFIREMTSTRTGLWELSLHSDPLMSFRYQILALSCILDASSAAGADDYLQGPQWVAKQKELTTIMPFPSGLSDNGEFILITAGG